MIGATELALRLRSQFVVQPLYRRDGVPQHSATALPTHCDCPTIRSTDNTPA
jgi:hypothetical protein